MTCLLSQFQFRTSIKFAFEHPTVNMYSYLLTLLILFVTSFVFLYSYAKNRFKYWQERSVSTLDNQNVIFGDFCKPLLGRENLIVTAERAYRTFKSKGCKFGGIYSLNYPMLLVIDPEIVKSVLVKDSEYFIDRGVDYDEESKPVSAHMFNLDGDEWKFIRRKLSPTFTSGKLKTMFWIIEDNIDKLCGILKKNGDSIYFTDLIERTGMDIISETAFGLKCNALDNDVSPFYLATQKVFHPSLNRIIYYAFKNVFKNHANINLLISDDPECNQFFLKLVEDTIKYRLDNNVRVNDFLQLLIDLMEPKDGEEGLSVRKIAPQAFVFFIAAYETTARSLTMAMYELGKDMDLQKQLREEIMNVLEEADGTFSYEMVMGCKLLDTFVKENLRKNPPVVFLNRICSKTYTMPGTDIEIEKGTPILIPVYSIHMDEDNYKNPETFDINRFSKENEANLKPHTYLPFGEGPRYCIGNRLALYQVKLTIMKLVKNFNIAVNPKTEEPLTFSRITDSLLLTFKQKMYYNFEAIDC